MSKNDATGTCYLYVLDTMADWEVAHLTAELHSGRFTARGRKLTLTLIGADTRSVVSMGGMEITPRMSAADVEFKAGDLLVLPGADRWSDARHSEIIEWVPRLLEAGVVVAAVCGAVVALAEGGILDTRNHTSNGKGFLEMMCPAYKGTSYFIDAPVAVDGNLITASGLAPLEFTYEIFKKTGAMRLEVLESWYRLYHTRDSHHFFALMEALQKEPVKAV